ncbi:DNA polymerase III subunit gamma/tau [Alphaproteobacteria bacterium]|nr:DNA polymerase III subunit gamma/tau [Alphaproteobacteria bacterium]
MEQNSVAEYQVLARKYRPDNFDALIGQDALVRTLSNAITLNRLAHAFILTGVRGVGKTTTARILAKGLNCIGSDGNSGPTMQPCNQCEPCLSIQAAQHVDILEMDAASHTGVDDIREIIDGSVYRPVSARYKIYIIDEVHMLSKNAFNALLKTLEEPPEAVKFIFATTEIRKVPITILSRCQRFDLRRVPLDLLISHLDKICTAEKINSQSDAIRLLAYAAGGSVRDALSLLDQASALGSNDITVSVIEDMLGHANSDGLMDLLHSCLNGDIQTALTSLKKAVDSGAEPEQILSDLMDFTHQASLIASNSMLEDVSESSKEKLTILAKFGIPRLARCWQILLKGHQEIKAAPRPESAVQMLIIRLAYTAPMPTPSEILDKLPNTPLEKIEPSNTKNTPSGESEPPSNSDNTTKEISESFSSISNQTLPVETSEMVSKTKLESEPSPVGANLANKSKFEHLRDIAEFCEQQGALILAADIRKHVELVKLEAPHLELHLVSDAPEDLPGKIAHILNTNSNERWFVAVSDTPGLPTLQKTDAHTQQQKLAAAAEHPVAKKLLETFQGAEVVDVIPKLNQDNQTASTDTQTPELGKNTKIALDMEDTEERDKIYDA